MQISEGCEILYDNFSQSLGCMKWELNKIPCHQQKKTSNVNEIKHIAIKTYIACPRYCRGLVDRWLARACAHWSVNLLILGG